jgi:hypothetical protein
MLTPFIVILGVATVVLSLVVAFRFSCSRSRSQSSGDSEDLTMALSWQLVGEAVIGFGTLIFAIFAHFNLLGGISDEIQSLIRLLMFAATSLTTIHLWRTVKRLQR